VKGLLLDTHIVLWWLSEPSRIPSSIRKKIADPEIPVFVSAGCLWEMSIKCSLGRLRMPNNLLEVLARESMEILAIDARHALEVGNLPLIHQDPFDRIQLAQAKIEGLTLVTRDQKLQRYGIPIL
jgi:PIN domain nuclease of toxin-antitoxin system